MTTTPPKSRRRFLRFSLKGLLFLVLIAAVAFGWARHLALEQGIAVAELEKMECVFGYPYQEPLTVLERLRMLCSEKEPRDVAMVEGRNSRLTDAGLVHLERLTQLQFLGLDVTQITDAGLIHVERLTQLESLQLGETQITDAGLAHLERLTQLNWLYLNDTQVTDAGLVHLERLMQLKWLGLDGTQVTDAGLVHLERLTQLQTLFLNGSQVTDAGVQELRKALPNCTIQR